MKLVIAIVAVTSVSFFCYAGYQAYGLLQPAPQQAVQPAAAQAPLKIMPGHYPQNWTWPAPHQFDPVTGCYPWAEINMEQFGRNAIGDGMYRSCIGPNWYQHRDRYIMLYGPPPY